MNNFVAGIAMFLAAFGSSMAADWQKTNAPLSGRYDDIHFVDSSYGWAVGNAPVVAHTQDGGQTWLKVGIPERASWPRSVKFLSRTHGFMGALPEGAQVSTLFETLDGGTSWHDVSDRLGSKMGVCGMFALGDSSLFAVGSYYGDTKIVVSQNAGNSFSAVDVKDVASGLVDIHMFSALEGLASGQASDPAEGGLILRTVDGGKSWGVVYKTGVPNDWFVWKIQFINRHEGFASIENRTPKGGVHFLKTKDGGITWTRHEIWTPQPGQADKAPIDPQGIGFANSQLGWIGGWGPDFTNGPTFETTDGGEHWREVVWGKNLNRFYFLEKLKAFAVGEQVYRYGESSLLPKKIQTKASIDGQNFFFDLNVEELREGFRIVANYNRPNYMLMDIVDQKGYVVAHVKREPVEAGRHEAFIERKLLARGQYFAVLKTHGPKRYVTIDVH
jgi:photosystem II stability/assembly factor-like uncharacterized protein